MAEGLRSEDGSVGCVGSVLSSSVVSRDPRPSGLQGLHLDPGNQTARYQFLCSLKWKEEKRLSWDFQYFRIRIFKRQIKNPLDLMPGTSQMLIPHAPMIILIILLDLSFQELKL